MSTARQVIQCEHKKQKHNCVICNDCGHGKLKYNCKDCGGSQICEHNKNKRICKECGGKGICEHNRDKRVCRDCVGSQICEHNKHKRYCKECGGSGICVHNKQHRYCKECGGSCICEHNNVKRFCKECGGSSICEHNIIKRYCKVCIGSQICSHGIDKSYCADCGGSRLCDHNKRKHLCKDCNGASICIHEKLKSFCKDCGGSSLCKMPFCETISNPKYKGHCLTCFVNLFPDEPNVRNYKTKEKDIVDRITEIFTNFTWIADKKVQDGCSRRRPDLLLDMGSHIIIVEVDENKHTDYDCSCEHKRLMELSQDLHHRPVVFIRFNPDDYTNLDGVLIKSCWKINRFGIMQIIKTKQREWEDRIDTLKQQIQYWIDNPTEKTIEIIELFY